MRNDIQPIPDPEDPYLHAEYCPCQTCVRDRRFRGSVFAVGRPQHYDEDMICREYVEEEYES